MRRPASRDKSADRRTGVRACGFLLLAAMFWGCADAPAVPERESDGLSPSRADSVWAVADTIIGGWIDGPRILVFGDLQCPSCARLLQGLMEAESNGALGQATLGLIHVPAPAHIRSPIVAAPLGCLTSPDLRSRYLTRALETRHEWMAGSPAEARISDLLGELDEAACADFHGSERGVVRRSRQKEWAERLLIGWSPTVLIGRTWLPREASGLIDVLAMLDVVGRSSASPRSSPDSSARPERD